MESSLLVFGIEFGFLDMRLGYIKRFKVVELVWFYFFIFYFNIKIIYFKVVYFLVFLMIFVYLFGSFVLVYYVCNVWSELYEVLYYKVLVSF